MAGRFFVIYAFLAITFNYYIFATFFFSNIPEAIGGGQPPFVRIIFNNTPPVDITSQFKAGSEPTIQYFGELVYMDGDSVFLSVPGLFNNEVYEFQRSDIMVVGYSRSNEATMEVIKVQQEFFEQLSP